MYATMLSVAQDFVLLLNVYQEVIFVYYLELITFCVAKHIS